MCLYVPLSVRLQDSAPRKEEVGVQGRQPRQSGAGSRLEANSPEIFRVLGALGFKSSITETFFNRVTPDACMLLTMPVS